MHHFQQALKQVINAMNSIYNYGTSPLASGVNKNTKINP